MNAKPLDLLIQGLLSCVTVFPDKLTCRNVQTALKKKLNTKYIEKVPNNLSNSWDFLKYSHLWHFHEAQKFPKQKVFFL